MRYVELRPSADLARDVQCFWGLEGRGDVLAEPIFPDGRVEIVIHLGARPRRHGEASAQPEVMVVGQMTTALRLLPAPGLHAVGIRFTPAGARAWLGAPLAECTDAISSLDQVDPRLATSIGHAMRGGGLEPSRGAIEAALRQTHQARWASSPALEHAVQIALARHGRIRVDAMAASAGIGVRQLERQFMEAVGLSPKAFIRTARLQRALRLLRGGEPPAGVAEACGFADQAHLAREFRSVAGVPAREVRFGGLAFLSDPSHQAGIG